MLHIWLPLAARFIRSHRRKSLAAGLFITVGTAVLVFMHAMTMGINDTMVLNTTSLHTGHAFAEFKSSDVDPVALSNNLVQNPHVRFALPRYRFAGVIRSDKGSSPSLVFGVSVNAEKEPTAVSNRITQGAYPTSNTNEALLGKALAQDLNLKVGDSINIWQSLGTNLGTYTIKGIFETGIERFDKGAVYVPIETFDNNAVEASDAEVAVFLRNPDNLNSTVSQLNDSMPSEAKLKLWTSLSPDLVQLISLNSVSTTILMVLVFALVGFGIANIFVLTIVERFRELGILKAMGMTPREIVLLIFLESFMVCVAATITGILLGWGFSELSAAIGIDLEALTSHNRYFVVSGIVYPRVTVPGLALPAIISLVVSLVTSWLPSRMVARRLTAEALRSL